MLNLPGETGLRFAIWMVVGIGLYCLYERSHSRCNTPGNREDTASNAARRA